MSIEIKLNIQQLPVCLILEETIPQIVVIISNWGSLGFHTDTSIPFLASAIKFNVPN